MSTSGEWRQPTRVAVVGTDLKFIQSLIETFGASSRYEVRVDEWPTFRGHDTDTTREVLAWADTIVCEWAGPNAVIASQQKGRHQNLIVRLHRMELGHSDWRDIDIDAVDLVVTVGPYYRHRVIEVTGWPEDKVRVVPNAVDVEAFDLPKTEDARFHLGMIGVASSRKRLDLGLDVLRELRARDERFRLFVKGAYPWGLKWVEDRPDEVAYFADVRNRLDSDPLLGEAVTFDPPGPDVPEWLRKIGWVLSTSDDESFHLSPAEGMASGAVPVIRSWPGADEIYDRRWVVDIPTGMAQRIAETDELAWREEGARAREEVRSKYAFGEIAQQWLSEVLPTGRPGGSLRVSLLSSRNPYRDGDFMALARSLASVGHRVSIISRAAPAGDLPTTVVTPTVEEPHAPRFSWRWLKRRFAASGADDALTASLEASRPDLVYPQQPEDVPLADRVGAPVVRAPSWPQPDNDLVTLAPHSPALSSSPTGAMTTGTALPEWPAYTPTEGRHAGVSAVVAYRVTPTSPGRYLETALRRAGVSVTVMDGQLDWNEVGSDTDMVVVVESPYPALTVTGAKPAIPLLFWVHHGEHHLPANLRLTRRYRADAVLLAHSWHLAHRFPVPTHRFPFGVATELDPNVKPWDERTHDVAMVGAGIGGTGGRYDRRRRIVDALESAHDIRVEFAYGLSPGEMADLYGDARIVVNDGGPRHFPITMRVFEALGSGALLLTEDIPGTGTILTTGEHYESMRDDVDRQVREILEDGGSPSIAAEGRRWALDRHTYDHRVDRLVAIARQSDPGRSPPDPFQPRSPLATLIDQDVEVQHLAVFGDAGELGLGDRAIREGDTSRLGERSIDAVAVGSGEVGDLRRAVLAARGYVYSTEDHAGAVQEIVSEERPDAIISSRGGLLRADIGGIPYRMRAPDHPLAR